MPRLAGWLGDREEIAFGVGELGESDALTRTVPSGHGDPAADIRRLLEGRIEVVDFEAETGLGLGAAFRRDAAPRSRRPP